MVSQTSKPSFFKGNAIPFVIIAVCLAVGLLAQAGYIDFPKVGKQVKYLLDPPDDSPDLEVMKLTDGVVGDPYYESSVITIVNRKCVPPCKWIVEPFMLPAGIEFNENDASLSGTPTVAGTWTFDVCFEDAEIEGCFDDEFSITIKPKKEPSPYRGECPTKPNPPCHSVQENGEIPVQAEGMLTYDYCKCPEGTHPEGVDNVSPGAPYIICMCD